MAQIVRNQRTGCALHGALQTIEALPGVIPILHANAGCGFQSYLAEKAAGRGVGAVSGNGISGTCSQERHVIFGGASRLREQIKNAVKVQSGQLYVVLNSCEAAMVGDDVDAMVEESVEQGNPVVSSLNAGFQGDSHVGYENVLINLLKKVPQLPQFKADEGTHDRPVVNIFGILPATDTFWQGDVDAITELLDEIGVEAHAFLNSADVVHEIAQAGKADLSLVFSKWGIRPAEYLEETYDVPVQIYDSVPSGLQAVSALVKGLTEKLKLDTERVDNYLKRAEEYTYRYLGRLRDIFYEKRLNRRILLVGEENAVTSAAAVLNDYLKTPVTGAIITDEKTEKDTEHDFGNPTLKELTDQISYSSDLTEIEAIIGRSDAGVILGSTFEKRPAGEKEAAFLQISEPVSGVVILNRTYAGIRGAIRLTEDYINSVLS